MKINMYDFILGNNLYYCVPVVTHVFKSEDINIDLTKDIPIVYIVCWYKTSIGSSLLCEPGSLRVHVTCERYKLILIILFFSKHNNIL